MIKDDIIQEIGKCMDSLPSKFGKKSLFI